jgi:hypothetical protein
MNKNIVASVLSSIAFLGLLATGLWGGSILICIFAVSSLLGSFLIYKNKKVGKIICLVSICIQLIFSLKLIFQIINENSVNPYASYLWLASIYFIGVPIFYLILTLVFVVRSKPTE